MERSEIGSSSFCSNKFIILAKSFVWGSSVLKITNGSVWFSAYSMTVVSPSASESFLKFGTLLQAIMKPCTTGQAVDGSSATSTLTGNFL